MTTHTKNIGIIIGAVLLVGVGAFYLGKQSTDNSTITDPVTNPVVTTATSTTQTPTSTQTTPAKTNPSSPGTITKTPTIKGFRSYTDNTYGFTIQYPPYVKTSNSFSTFHELGTNWRLNAGQANQGKPVASFNIYTVDQGSISNGKQSYPLFFTAEVRIGVSPNTQECYTPDAGYTNQKVTNVIINGKVFKKFSSSTGGMMKYVQSESYRTIHNNKCFVIEQIKNGSNYRDEKMATGTPESTLTGYYNTGETIIKTFKFLQ